MRRTLLVAGVAVVSFVAGAAIAGRPETVSHDLPAREIPTAVVATEPADDGTPPLVADTDSP